MGRSISINFSINTNYIIIFGAIIFLIGVLLFLIPNSTENNQDFNNQEKENSNLIGEVNELDKNNYLQYKNISEENIPIKFENELDSIIPYLDADVIKFEEIIIECANYESPYEKIGEELYENNSTINLRDYREELKQYAKEKINPANEEQINCLSKYIG